MPVGAHRRFDLGMNQDEASYLLAEGYAYSTRNMLFDKLGISRKRGGISGVGATTTYNGDQLGALVDDTGLIAFYSRGVSGNILTYVNTATGALVNLGGSNFGDLILNGGGRPFQHYGTLIYPCFNSNPAAAAVAPWAVAGAKGALAHAFTAPASIAITAGDKRIVCAAADSPTTTMEVGNMISITGPTNTYVGRVTRLVSTTAFEVYPTPSISQPVATNTVAVANYAMSPSTASNINGYSIVGGKVGMSYQGRVCLGNVNVVPYPSANRLELYPRRFIFSSTLIEGNTVAAASAVFQGAVWLTTDGYPVYNYFDIPVQEAITAMTPTGFGDALIFSAFRTFRMTGNLSTQFGLQQSITWTVREIPNSVGCITERSLQRTPHGVVFAHDSGIYATDGTSMQPLMHLKMQNYWNGLQRPGFNFAIYGSALVRGNHYYICGTSNGLPWALMLNLDTLAWGPFTGKAAAPASFLINSAAQDPGNAARTWALKWWDESGAAPSMTGGQLLTLDTIFVPSSGNRADSDGTVVSFEHITPPYAEAQPTLQKTFEGASLEYNNIGGAAVSVTAAQVLDSADIPAGGNIVQLPPQDVKTVTAATGAGLQIVLTIGAGHAIPADAWVRVTGVTGNTAANGLWRVGAVTSTTLTLMGSIGNAAYISGGTVQPVDARDFTLLNTVPIGGNPIATAYRINDTDLGAPGADVFELIGITQSYDVREVHDE